MELSVLRCGRRQCSYDGRRIVVTSPSMCDSKDFAWWAETLGTFHLTLKYVDNFYHRRHLSCLVWDGCLTISPKTFKCSAESVFSLNPLHRDWIPNAAATDSQPCSLYIFVKLNVLFRTITFLFLRSWIKRPLEDGSETGGRWYFTRFRNVSAIG